MCSSPVREQLERAIDAGQPLRQLAATSGYSRASLSRHNRRCRNRQAIETHRRGKFDPLRQLVFSKFPDGSLIRLKPPFNFLGELRDEPGPNDVVVQIEFEQQNARTAPIADPPTADAA